MLPLHYGASLVVQKIENLPAVQETWAQSLGWEDPLEEVMATHSCILAQRIPMDRRAWRATVHWVAESDTTEVTWHTGMHGSVNTSITADCKLPTWPH